MTFSERIYTINPRSIAVYQGKHNTPIYCHRCHEKIKVGDTVVRKQKMSGKSKYYHQTCWEALHL